MRLLFYERYADSTAAGAGADYASGDELHTDEACKEEVSILVTDNEESILGPQCATSEC
jgi:hypothetical protein